MKILIALCLFVTLALAVPSELELKKQFLDFQHKFNKIYADDAEFTHRYSIFKRNMEKVEHLNRNEQGSATYGVTKFSDLSEEEFAQQYLMPKHLHSDMDKLYAKAPVVSSIPNISAPLDGMDWRDKGVISHVYNQGQCGSCWAFSATETVESYWRLCSHPLVSLSVQQVVDCDTTSYGCNGGWTEHAYEYIIGVHGQEKWQQYPYHAADGTCKFHKADIDAHISSFKYVTKTKDEKAMLSWVTSKGPLSVCVDASAWSSYTGGVVKSCGKQIDHCVQVTGYSTVNGVEAWHVRNSWGTDWGVSGYIFVERNHDVCAIAEDVTIVEC